MGIFLELNANDSVFSFFTASVYFSGAEIKITLMKTSQKKTLEDDKELKKRTEKLLLGESMSDFIAYLRSPWRILWANLLAGIFRGLGIIIGMTVVIALLVWVLSQMVNFPLIGQYFQELLNILKQFSPSNGY